METVPDFTDVPQTDPVNSGSKLWKTLLFTFLGTTMSIVLTFGASQLVQQQKKVKDRELTTLMVISSVEKFAQTLDNIASEIAWRDTLATMLLAIPMDSLDNPEHEQLVSMLVMVGSLPQLSYDKSAEQIFSNSMETWKNLGNFRFINNVGKCFDAIKYIQEDYTSFIEGNVEAINRVTDRPDEYAGESKYSKALHDPLVRSNLSQLHKRSDYYRYLAECLRYLNSMSMSLMNVSEETILDFITKNEEEMDTDRDVPYQQNFTTPKVSVDSLPEFSTWIQSHQF